ncbi:MAG: hypothetical protein CBE48_003315 [Flavobacteriales bacterium TMED288]|nr:MAG: hypothetical protein CBE48_003315 [Flavobacteriales bacterium TMED288]|tara:strand:+ start:16685 stop:18865 length:2181 start_codon:yes stop_codon:yes gene_type:complete
MKKILNTLFLFFLISFLSLLLIISTIGIETNRFNDFISQKINQSNKNINIKLDRIKFKLDVKNISLFLETFNPKIIYRNATIPAKKIKVYIDFFSIVKSEPKIKKINLIVNEIKIEDLKKISNIFKPSNLKSFINNKIKAGKISSELEIYLNENNLLENFIAKGSVENLKTEISKNLFLEKTNFNFFADKSDVLIKRLFGKIGPAEIKDGDLILRLGPEISIQSNFITNLNLDNKSLFFKKNFKNSDFLNNLNLIKTELNNSFTLNFDKTYKIKNYDFKSDGKILKAEFNISDELKDKFYSKKIEKIFITNSTFKTDLNNNQKKMNILGKYSLTTNDFLNFNIISDLKNETLNLKLNFDYDEEINIELLNYKKLKGNIAEFSIDLNKLNDSFNINEISYKENKNAISLEGIKIKNKKFLKLDKVSIETYKNGKKNNDFFILYGRKIFIKGNQFDATNLPKILNQETKTTNFSNVNKEIEIDIASVIAPSSEKLLGFRLIGQIDNGKFTKISSKSSFGNDNFLDITMRKNKNNKKYLEIYSDLTKPLLTEFSFFNGLTGGNLSFTSIIDQENSSSNLKIENFKVVNAPGMVKLLSLADLRGLADLAEGEGISFDILEINFEKNKNDLVLNEILALGPSISVLMEGYQNQSITSLRGTLVPAKTINKMISKIPLIGDIIIPKEVGEGLFGISFKMKGPAGKIKTTINPIRTITPRFIQKIIDRNKSTK